MKYQKKHSRDYHVVRANAPSTFKHHNSRHFNYLQKLSQILWFFIMTRLYKHFCGWLSRLQASVVVMFRNDNQNCGYALVLVRANDCFHNLNRPNCTNNTCTVATAITTAYSAHKTFWSTVRPSCQRFVYSLGEHVIFSKSGTMLWNSSSSLTSANKCLNWT